MTTTPPDRPPPHHLGFMYRATIGHYWKKLRTCGHPDDRSYVGVCSSRILSNTVCSEISYDNNTRKSHPIKCHT